MWKKGFHYTFATNFGIDMSAKLEHKNDFAIYEFFFLQNKVFTLPVFEMLMFGTFQRVTETQLLPYINTSISEL